ncbi:hypothetical protein P7C70_g516, partial [Phenoliferia sp. Uapishka_3]
MPILPKTGFGLWKVPGESAAETVYQALKAGYRLLDGAADYGNEKECGDGLKRAISEGIVKREEVYVVSKLWNTFHAKEHVPIGLQRSLSDWGVSYFDLYLIHFPVSLKYVDPSVRYPPEWWDGTPGGPVTPSNVPVAETWSAMEDAHTAGLAKEIGISNFNGSLLIDLIRGAKIPPSVIQIEHHRKLYHSMGRSLRKTPDPFTSAAYLAQPAMTDLCLNVLKMQVMAYSSFGPQSFLEIGHEGALAEKSLLDSPVIAEVAKKHGKTPAQVLLRWATQRNITVIPKSNNVQRAAQNLSHENFQLKKEDFESIATLDKGLRFNNPAGIDARLAFFA